VTRYITLTLLVQEVSFSCSDMGNLMDKITSAAARVELFKQVMGGCADGHGDV
jgi:hypothetical protein